MSKDCFLGINLFYTFFDGAFITLVHEFNNVMRGHESWVSVNFQKAYSHSFNDQFYAYSNFIICKKVFMCLLYRLIEVGGLGKTLVC